MKCLILLLALIAVVIPSVTAFAADESLPNDPNVNPDANACFEGGIWAGKCGDSGYLWEGGWYLIRYFASIIPRNQFPDQYKWALPTLEEEAAVDYRCYIEVGPGLFELAPETVLNGKNGGSFYWNDPTDLESSYSSWQIWDSTKGFYTGYYGDCSPLGIGAPLPDGVTIVIAKI